MHWPFAARYARRLWLRQEPHDAPPRPPLVRLPCPTSRPVACMTRRVWIYLSVLTVLGPAVTRGESAARPEPTTLEVAPAEFTIHGRENVQRLVVYGTTGEAEVSRLQLQGTTEASRLQLPATELTSVD